MTGGFKLDLEKKNEESLGLALNKKQKLCPVRGITLQMRSSGRG